MMIEHARRNELMPNFARLLWYLGNSMRRLHWDREKLRKYQEKRLRSAVRNAYDSVSFYHEKFRQANVSPDDIKTLEDLSKLPITNKDEFKRQEKHNRISKNFDIGKLKVIETSGSSGQPFQIYLTPSEDDWRKAIYMRANISCGQKVRDRWVVITSPGHFRDTTNLQRKLGVFAQTYVSVFKNASEQIEYVEKVNPNILDGYSSSLLLFAKEAERRKLKTIKPRIVFGTAELIDSDSRSLIEKAFGAPYYDQFGCAELDRTAWQCPMKVGYHLDVDSAVTQFVDENGDDVSPGERGEIVYTSLFNYSMPIIRYAVGDVGVPSKEKCCCDRTLPMMEVVEGRKNSFLRLPDGRIMSPLAFAVAIIRFELRDQINQYRIIQKKPDLFKIYIEKRAGTDGNLLKSRLQKHLADTLRQHAGTELSEECFDVEFVDKISVDVTGKHKVVSSEISSW